jgi:hypothetical protein
MSSSDPLSGYPLSRGGRAGMFAASLVLVAGFALARWLEPDPRGFGTHERLGLPECTFQLLWNRPCPGCGMTTCFANLVRGDWRAAARANPAGVLLGAICALLIPWMWASAWKGAAIGINDPLAALLALVLILAAVTAGVWLWRFWI